MKPEEYVHLLYDEASFPRSRFYFWAIGCLSAFEENLTTNIHQLRAFRKFHAERGFDQSSLYAKDMGERLNSAFENLEDIAEQLRKKLGALRALRDGLFSASGVMESRQSRVLGENVRLLTFVSIFFLPLGLIIVSSPHQVDITIKLIVSHAFWSVPDVNSTWSGIRTPVCVSAIGGIITYLVVFNLDLLESLARSALSGPRNYLVGRMAFTGNMEPTQPLANRPEPIGGKTDRWQSRAKDFEVFPRRDQNPKPSDWWLLLFAVRLSFTSAYNILSKPFRNRPAPPVHTLPLHSGQEEQRTEENTGSGNSSR
ncbi:hypothetical protein BDV95DRAFT_602359 [Massariosphaeria phaeospora]|uniref:Uncharacterized protein n=1 Tax=Massariosphaeria phaeospora TaxID=100035 RepID=A0A7C8IKC1_9PLEO|nr:hypothetical protein BDV95DRAFT_602359 [Massariosphaeria phaeospora]